MGVPFKRCKLGRRSVENCSRFLLLLRFCAGFPGALFLFSTFCTIQSSCGVRLNSYEKRKTRRKQEHQKMNAELYARKIEDLLCILYIRYEALAFLKGE